MSKFDPLWKYIGQQEGDRLKLSYEEIQNIAGIPIDHSFLKYKKDLLSFGWQVERISMKEQWVLFCRAK